MSYQHVPRPQPTVGGSARVQGRPGLHLIIDARPTGSLRIACNPKDYKGRDRWYSSGRMVDEHFTCAVCLLTLPKDGLP